MVQLHKYTRQSQFPHSSISIRTHGLFHVTNSHQIIPKYLCHDQHPQYPRKWQWMVHLGYVRGQFLLRTTVPIGQDNETYRRNGNASSAGPSHRQRAERPDRTSHLLPQISYLYVCLEWRSISWEQGSQRSLLRGCTCRQWYRCDKQAPLSPRTNSLEARC